MRAPFQVLALPYRIVEHGIEYCVLHRSDFDQWQFISGGGEDDETPEQAVRREIREESGITAARILRLTSMCYIGTGIYPQKYRECWPTDLYVIPEYSFGFECTQDIQLSDEHTHFEWLTYEEARKRLTWDSNRTALYELDCRIRAGINTKNI